ncbi:Hypothetical predicted protein [Mytilus galloprovincialis]|uniref:Uncharacterized protein n=1 Tax=Mytilus galloprovincialis TaxID=29158 RepID=A0A8B6H0A2_MYTGA|nr:Hypothetical predicted protein [Mytilus galloprovincialis]
MWEACKALKPLLRESTRRDLEESSHLQRVHQRKEILKELKIQSINLGDTTEKTVELRERKQDMLSFLESKVTRMAKGTSNSEKGSVVKNNKPTDKQIREVKTYELTRIKATTVAAISE